MSTLQIALIGIALLLLLAWLWLRGRAGATAPEKRAADRIDTLAGWPPQATRVLSKAEMLTLGTLVRALPEYLVLAQVPLARFIDVPKRNSYADWLRRVGYQCVDFLVCDMSAQVVAVIELQPLQMSERARKRHDRIERTLKAAQIPLHVWRDSGLPSPEAAREALLPRLAASAVAAAGVAAAAAAAAQPSAPPARNPFDDTGRDSSHDETIELLEPPPSTWFDDMDSDPIPLSKR
jgi:hypothetical protein